MVALHGGRWQLGGTRMPFWRPIGTFLELPRDERHFFLCALLLAPSVSGALAVLGFRRTASLVRRAPALGRGGPDSALSNERAEALVRRAFRWAHLRRGAEPDGCLPRALVRFGAHRLLGERARIHVGVPRRGGWADRSTFVAHAWVECDGACADTPDYVVIMTVGA